MVSMIAVDINRLKIMFDFRTKSDRIGRSFAAIGEVSVLRNPKILGRHQIPSRSGHRFHQINRPFQIII